ncbi:AAA family ATPase [Variovorax paradoxus]|uniref:AAA family ATPase n=1 Tax=Variovorax paradoxus TaxID=34073 RepID=UPI003D652D53
MTRFEPTLIVNELRVLKDGVVILSESFHVGLNIIKGHNSSGKTTTLDFLAFGLGSEEIPWKKQALLCDFVIAEVSLNGRRVTLKRQISEERQRPMHIFWGKLADAQASAFQGWELYPYKRSEHKLGFTQSLFLALGMPEAQGDGASNLTMHQFLRVIYADQPSLHQPIFRNDNWDSALTRETVGNYISGVYDDTLYSAQLEKRGLEKELGSAESELRSIFTVLAKSKQDIGIEFFGQQIVEAESRREALHKEILRLKSERTIQADKKRKSEETPFRKELDEAKRTLTSALDQVALKEAELADTNEFVMELDSRLISLEESEQARKYFGGLSFQLCPCCLAEVKPAGAAEGSCSLCKSPISGPAGDAQLLRMKNELRLQVTESQSIAKRRADELQELRRMLPSLRQELKKLEKKYDSATESWSSDLEMALEAAARDAGALDQEIKGLYENQRLASVIEELRKKRNSLVERIDDLQIKITTLEDAQEKLKHEVSAYISSTLGRLLRKDLYRQAEFKTAENVHFSFTDNKVAVDGSDRFSESSTVVLRLLFHVALLSASTKIKSMRFPRFLILDGIEDGGMELPRSHLLQRIIAEECATYEVEYQLIMATSQITPELDNNRFVVGREFTEDDRAIQILQ